MMRAKSSSPAISMGRTAPIRAPALGAAPPRQRHDRSARKNDGQGRHRHPIGDLRDREPGRARFVRNGFTLTVMLHLFHIDLVVVLVRADPLDPHDTLVEVRGYNQAIVVAFDIEHDPVCRDDTGRRVVRVSYTLAATGSFRMCRKLSLACIAKSPGVELQEARWVLLTESWSDRLSGDRSAADR
jgi:hypothetical protein